MSLEEKLEGIHKDIKAIQQRLGKLENHVYHPPHVLKLLNYIKEREVVTLSDLRSRFPKLHGGNLSRLYASVISDRRFRVVRGFTRWSPTVFAYFGDYSGPQTMRTRAVDFFQRISPGKEGTLARIKRTYNVDEDDAKKIMELLISLFKARIKVTPNHKAFRRRY